MAQPTERKAYSVGDIVQIKPGHPWGLSLAVVSEIRTWGAIAYVAMPHNDGTPVGLAYQRLQDEEFEIVGQARWVFDREGWVDGGR